MERYSDARPYEERRYWYFTLHGTGPGTIPKDLRVLETREGQNEKGTWGTYILLDGVLTTDELHEFDLKEMIPYKEEKSRKQIINEYLREQKFNELYEVDTEGDIVIISIKNRDWDNHSQLRLKLQLLMDKFGYDPFGESSYRSDDYYTVEYEFIKR